MVRSKNFNTKYSPEFKVSVILDMRKNGLSYQETMYKYWITGHHTIQDWEHIYLTEGAEGFMKERHGQSQKGERPKKLLDKRVGEDLIAENQRLKERNEYLEMENEYLKKLDALVRAEERQSGRKPK